VIPRNCRTSISYGAGILRDELREYFGLKVSIASEGEYDPDKQAIFIGVVGRNPRFDTLVKATNMPRAPAGKAESYSLVSSDRVVVIAGNDPRGALYGIQTLLWLIRRTHDGKVSIPSVKIIDWPEMKIRGMMLGVGYCTPAMFKHVVRRVVARKNAILL